jgi:hypothetical protein
MRKRGVCGLFFVGFKIIKGKVKYRKAVGTESSTLGIDIDVSGIAEAKQQIIRLEENQISIVMESSLRSIGIK